MSPRISNDAGHVDRRPSLRDPNGERHLPVGGLVGRASRRICIAACRRGGCREESALLAEPVSITRVDGAQTQLVNVNQGRDYGPRRPSVVITKQLTPGVMIRL